MERKFVNQYLKTYKQSSCVCLTRSIKFLQEEMIESKITFQSMKNLLKPIPPDLKIICEDNKEYSSHKLLFGLLNATLANLFLEEDFTNDKVTLFLPVDSVLFENEIFDDFSSVLKNKLDEVVSRVDVPFATNFAVPTHTTIFKVDAEEEPLYHGDNDLNNSLDFCEEGEIQPSPVQIKIRKKKKYTKKFVHEKRIKNENAGKRIPKSTIRCENCNALLNEGTNMEVHLIACKQKGERREQDYKVICPVCGKSLRRSAFEGMHYYRCSNWTVPGSDLKKAKYEKENNQIACDECGKLLLNENCLKSHLQHVHNVDNIFHHCDKCDFKTSNKSTLRNHIKSVHDVAYITCHICGKKVKGHKDQDRLRRHIRMYHEEQKMVKCDICGKEFKHSHIQKHIKNIHEERKFPCELCSYKAQTSFNLKLHISKSHLGVKELPKSQCQYCEVVTTNLPYHLKRYHPDHV